MCKKLLLSVLAAVAALCSMQQVCADELKPAEPAATTNAPVIRLQPAAAAPATNVTALSDRDEAYDQIELMTEIMLHVRKFYVDEKSYKQITAGALHGMLQALDPHSDFLEEEAFKSIQEDTSGKFSGVGIHLGLRDGVLIVIAPIEDTPAFRAGILSQDKILAIDGEKTMSMSMGDAIKRLRGTKGTKVTVTIGRRSEEDTIDIDIIRDDIEVPSVKGARILKDGVGYIRITQFAAPTVDSFQESMDKLSAEGMQALVLDLRRNPGGLLKSAIGIAEKFLKNGELIVTTRGRPGVGVPVENRAAGGKHYTDMPLVVLVDGGSASASEIVAGALQDHKRAVLIGDTTFGKGSVQSVIQLRADGKDAIRLTTALYYTPANRQINDKGIEPDIPVYVGPQEWQKIQARRAQVEQPALFTDEEKKLVGDVVDPQLQRALDVIQAIRVFK